MAESLDIATCVAEPGAGAEEQLGQLVQAGAPLRQVTASEFEWREGYRTLAAFVDECGVP
jgi:hypothetical protein